MLVYTRKSIPPQPPESDDGNKEYKIYLSSNNYKKKRKYRNTPHNSISKTAEILQQSFIENKSTQLLFRLLEGKGKALYLLGIEDSGNVRGMSQEEMIVSVENLKLMAKQIGAKIRIIRVYEGGKGFVCTVRLFLPDSIYYQKVKNSIV